MDFTSLGDNSIVHILRKKPYEYLTGKLVKKTAQQPQVAYIPQPTPQVFDIVISVNGNEDTVPGVKQGMAIVEYNGSYYATTTEGILQAMDGMGQMAASGKKEQPYYDDVLDKNDKYKELLSPAYAESKQQARTIAELQHRADAQDKKLDKILAFVQELSAPSPKK